jgi:hypothetical protein
MRNFVAENIFPLRLNGLSRAMYLQKGGTMFKFIVLCIPCTSKSRLDSSLDPVL